VRALQKKNAYTDALSLVSSILKDSPDNAEAYTLMGQIYMAQADFARADEIFRTGSTLANVEAELFLSWAKALTYIDFHDLAIEKFKQAADINPYDGDIYENWAQTLKSLGRFNEASEVYRQASSYL
jgi:Tfp pilus assembly protein PilF